ncbi:multicopper oxidase domain-containing protein [Granulicella arctica]|uniref:FtsP/CotA-like multicopper oxidase with cupredoxin domain n=1 Tax=Granulicella arctica TaxID=940613 RepID=A0A7Y9TEW4_9BACT|nr:multicopper oxidase domain-containing protein [Granulicella arctica]NYF78116.1 FtsP/CotA-like multicopper oxidase with cupredoxin domain [Granulicella arctica]
MNSRTQIHLLGTRERLILQVISRVFCFAILVLSLCSGMAMAQNAHAGRGAMSAQDMAKMVAQADSGSDAADQVCARFAAGAVVSAPPELKSSNGTLEVTFKFLTTTDSQGLVRYCYVTDTGLEAPTLRVNPGDTLIIHFQNDLPATSTASSADSMAGMKMTLSAKDTSSSSSACNGVMSANASNIHFHGMNVAPVCGQDEVVRTLVQPGQSLDYSIQIPANEPPGLYWYHPHPHGISEGQVQGGATGALIVEGLQSVDTALAGLTERTFVLRDQVLPTSEANDDNIPAWDLSINYVPVTYPGYTPAVIQTNPGQQELWRVANTAADTIMDLQYIVNGTAQAVQVVAIDGYPIAAGSSGQQSTSETSILLPPGARTEFVVTTPNVGDQAQLVTQYWNTGPDGDYDPTRTIATIVSQNGVENSTSATASVATRMASSATPAKVKRFAALAQATPAAQRNLYFSEVLLDPTDPNSPTTFFITEQGQQPAAFTMDQAPNIVVHSGTVEDWVIENHATEDHIFHIHQIHFQVLEKNGVAINDPAIRDTVDLPYWSGTGAYPSVKVRMDFRDSNIIGTFVYHCHILQHEDAGMMGEIQVLPAGSASSTTATASVSSITPDGTVTMTANVVDAATGATTPTGSVQFELNGLNVGDPVTLVNGQAVLTTTIDGSAGSSNLTAFYQGDTNYTESVSAAIPLTISDFALSSSGATAAVGSAAIATVTVNVADGYTTPINLTCTMPASLTESACFVNASSITGTGQVSLTVNTTPAHPLSSMRSNGSGWLAAGGGTTLASLVLLVLPRRKRYSGFLLALMSMGIFFAAIGCSGSTKTDPGTAKGLYTVVVTGTAGTGSSQVQSSVNVPITVQ